MKTLLFKDNTLMIDSLKISYNKIYFTSDLHFNHENIIKFCLRPFYSVNEMNSMLISNWNSVVTNDDIIIIVGDFMFGQKTQWVNTLSQLNGHKILIIGNHDKLQNIPYNKFIYVDQYLEISINDPNIKNKYQTIVCSHYPILCYNGQYKDFWQVYGHVHSRHNNTGLDAHLLKYLGKNQYDVGVDNNKFTPISYEQLKKIIHKQNER